MTLIHRQPNIAARIANTAQAAITAKAKKRGLTAKPHMIDSLTLAALDTWQATHSCRDVYTKIQRDADRVLDAEITAKQAISQLIDKISNPDRWPLLMTHQAI